MHGSHCFQLLTSGKSGGLLHPVTLGCCFKLLLHGGAALLELLESVDFPKRQDHRRAESCFQGRLCAESEAVARPGSGRFPKNHAVAGKGARLGDFVPQANTNASNCEASQENSWMCTVPLCTGARRERAIRNVVQTYTRKIRRRGRKMDGWKTGIRERKLVRLWGIRPAALVNFQRCGPVHFFSSSSIAAPMASPTSM